MVYPLATFVVPVGVPVNHVLPRLFPVAVIPDVAVALPLPVTGDPVRIRVRGWRHHFHQRRRRRLHYFDFAVFDTGARRFYYAAGKRHGGRGYS